MIGEPSNDIDNSIHIPRETKIKGDVFTGGKRQIYTGGGAYFEQVEHYHERRRPPAPRQAPALPLYFQPRPKLVEEILGSLPDSSQSIVAITGLTGVGKTTLASKTVRETAQRFSDGVLWGEFRGEVGEIQEVLGSFLNALDVDKEQFPTFDARVKALRSVLDNRRVLIILDDLLDENFDPFSLLPSNGEVCVFITTPNRNLAADITEHVVDVPPFTHETARSFLVEIIGDELLQLPEDLLNNILRRTGGMPLFLIQVGRQGRRIKRRGQKALQQWAANPDIDWGNLGSLYEFSYYQLSESERRAFEVLGLLAVEPLKPELIAVTLDIESSSARNLLEGLEANSLLDYTEEGMFRIHETVHAYIQNNLFDVSQMELPRQRLAQYLLNWVDTVEEINQEYEANLVHFQAIFEHSVQARDWSLINSFSGLTNRPITINGGAIQLIDNAPYFLVVVNHIDFPRAMLTRSDLRAACFNHCDFTRGTIGASKLSGAQFNHCGLTQTDLVQVDLCGAQFNHCDLAQTHLAQVNMQGVQFHHCDFTNTHLVQVDLKEAQFHNCNLTNFIFVDVNLENITFQECKGIEPLIASIRSEAE